MYPPSRRLLLCDPRKVERKEESHERDSWEPSNERRVAHSNANSGMATSAADHSDSTTGSLSTRNGPERKSVQSRYKKFKEHFSGIMGRLDQYRAEPSRSEFRSSSRTGNPLMANISNSLGRRSVLAAAKNFGAPPTRAAVDASLLYNAKSDEGNTSMYPQGDPSLNRSFDFNRPAVYGDDFVDAARRSRRTRLSRPNSRAKSEYGTVPEGREQFDARAYPLPPPQYTGNFPPSGRRSVQNPMGVMNPQEYYVQQAHMYKERRRPQSSFDPRAMERYQRAGGRYGQYDTYDDAHSSVSDGSDSDNGERGDSEEEIRKYTQKGRFGGPGESFNAMAVGEEMYYFGAIHLDQARVRSILLNFPPPVEYHRLPPIEKAAYLFFIAVYKKQYSDIGDFHRKFNREYYKYTCDGDTDNVALWKIDDIKAVVSDPYTVRLIDSAQTFKGPLLIGQTPTHSVRLYIERQIKRIRNGEVASENPRDNDVIDCLLIWQLLGIIVQQQGEAIDSALRDGLYADAMILARRLLAHDVAKLAEIEERFIATRPQCNPVVYDLGKALAKRDYNCAADFCFLAVSVLAGINPFTPIASSAQDGDARQHITLIHACLPDDDVASVRCRYGFSLVDLHATEIFDYAIRLSDVNAYSPLGESIEYQRKRIQYAHLIAEFGGFATDAFKLRYAASASDWETSWIASLRAMIQQKQQHQTDELPQSDPATNQQPAPPAPQSPQSPQSPLSNENYASPLPETHSGGDSEAVSPQQENAAENRSRSASLTSEARDWHAQRQDPLQMSPLLPRSTAVNAVVEENDGRTHAYANMEDPSTNSEDTSAQSTTESTPIRTLNHQTENLSLSSQAAPDYQRFSQQHMPPPAPHASQPLQSNRNAAPLPQNGLPETNMKGNAPVQIVWDPVKGRYVGAGVEEETASAPPPKLDGVSNAQSGSGGGLRAARTSGGSRYFNPLNQASNSNGAASPAPAAPVPVMQVPATFGFIPTMPDDAGESVDPFSGQANPTVHGVELTQAQ
ncbi:hypothetical protein TELCIR_09631 [Teladorsagia circumcincta]|uniref:Sec16 central conserved domain-containing protein n=1 Tax=Teladorsagia circumcincta TaxID=45464 RepID=A0A2G9UE86_TELCI|nr:hypothetical protein TELCIR_09631 [Teladorsagia circumcincta]